MRNIDIEAWSRKKQFYFFKQMDYPNFNICANVDITTLYDFSKRKNYSFFKVMVYAATKASNDIEEFRYRIHEDRVIVHELVHPSFTVLTKSEAFSFCEVKYVNSIADFCRRAEIRISEVENDMCLEDEPGRDDLLFMTSIPWVSFTSFTHPIDIKSPDSVPRLAWGKYFEENKRLKMPFSVQVHHALMDGIHVGKYFERLQEILDNPEKYLTE
jgi:chloramphenicol O-acetyltransferase type A